MDDFGTGYSSLSYLRRFPFDKIKIDQSFICEMTDHADSLAIVRAVIAMGSSLGIKTTAEGVETPEQFNQLRLQGCTEAQEQTAPLPDPHVDPANSVRDVRRRRGCRLGRQNQHLPERHRAHQKPG